METLDGGQAFRWRRLVQGDSPAVAFEGRWGRHVVRLRQSAENSDLEASLPDGVDEAAELSAILSYLSLDHPSVKAVDALPYRSDAVLARALSAYRGLRILAQPFGEALFCFMCSATKRIDQIKIICETVAERFGERLADGSHALPTWKVLATVGEDRLRACQLGYRARYIAQSAAFLAERPGWLDQVYALPAAEAREALQLLPGVGEKIADCTLLFGAGRLEVFPIDTWINQVMERLYGLQDWKKAQLQTFAKVHFGAYAGYAQQVLFAYVREQARSRAHGAKLKGTPQDFGSTNHS